MAETNANTTKPRVLVADDEQVIANTLAIILNQAGFEARAVYSGEKAIEALDTFKPDMLISDVIMTGMTGIEAASAILRENPRCAVIVYSGQPDILNSERATRPGLDYLVLPKPQPPEELLRVVRSAVAGWQ